MSKRKILSSKNYCPAPAASDSAPDLNLDILVSSAPYDVVPAPNTNKKKLKSSPEAAAAVPLTMDARVPDRDLPDDDDSAATSESSSDVINTEEEPFPRSCSFNKPTHAAAASSAFVFDILMRKEVRRSPDTPPLGGRPTIHQLFPESSSGGGAGSELAAAAPNQWLKLSEAAGEAPAPKQAAVQPRKSRRGPRSRSSQYRGVTFYRRTGRWESHIWDCGKQVYLGGFDTAHAAARAYDRAAIKFRGVDADINFTLSDYDDDMKATKDLSKEEFVHVLRRQSTGFSRGSSKYRGGGRGGGGGGGVTPLHKCGKWEARMGQLLSNNNNKAYEKASIEYSHRGTVALTNFHPRELDTSTCSSAGRGDDLDLRLGVSSPNSAANNARKNFTIMEARVPLVDKSSSTSTSGTDGPSSSSSRAGGPFGFQAPTHHHLHGLPIINIASNNNLSTWPPPPPPPASTFDPERQRVVVQGSNIPFLATATSWAHHHQFNSTAHNNNHGVSDDIVNAGVPKWPSSSPQQQQIAASSGFLSSSNSSNSRVPNVHIAGGGSSSSSPNAVNPFHTNHYWYSHNKRAQ